MNILSKTHSLRIRFAIGFGILFTFFLAVAFIISYISLGRFGREDYFSRLRDRAVSTYKLFIEVDQIDSSLLNVIDRNTPSSIAPQQRITVFEDSAIVYSNADAGQFHYDRVFFAKLKAEKELFTTMGTYQVYGCYKEINGKRYFIVAKGHDTYGLRKMKFLKWVMIAVYVAGVIIGWIVTYFFVKKIIHPLELLNINMHNINYNSLDYRLPVTGQGEEVDNLSVNFNQMLGRLEQSFNFQKDFVHYASHELRTPLAAMIGITENSMNAPIEQEQFTGVLQQLLQQQQNLTNITNSLLLLSGSKINSKEHEYPLIRLDEMVFRSVEISKNLFPNALIKVNLEGELSNEDSLLIHANEPLMLMAFNNLLKNAILYSCDNEVSILISVNETEKKIQFLNCGKNFTPDEEAKIFTPFYRASSSDNIKGHGLGLALVKQIAVLHDAGIVYSYEEGRNVFTITFAQVSGH